MSTELIELPLLASASDTITNSLPSCFSPYKYNYSTMSALGLNDGRARSNSQSSDLNHSASWSLDDLPGELSGGPYADMVDPTSDIYKALDYDLTRHFCDAVSEVSAIFLPSAPATSPKRLSPFKRYRCDSTATVITTDSHVPMLVPASRCVTNNNQYKLTSAECRDGRESDEEEIIVGEFLKA